MAPYLYLIVSGLMISFASFTYMVYNMAKHARNFLKDYDDPMPVQRGRYAEKNPLAGFGDMISRHLGAMVAMVFGGFAAMVGLAIAVCDFLNFL